MKFKFKILLTISALILFFSLNTLMCRAQNQSEMSEQGCQLLSELEEIQTEMNEQTYQTYEQADKKLNAHAPIGFSGSNLRSRLAKNILQA